MYVEVGMTDLYQ